MVNITNQSSIPIVGMFWFVDKINLYVYINVETKIVEMCLFMQTV